MIASRIGRKKTIIAGCTLLCLCFTSGFIVTMLTSEFSPALYVMFALVGLAWAAINVNSLPMVVEMCKGSDIGKFTGYYYTFSMAAQVFTPIASGWLIDHIGYKSLFPYSALFVLASIATMTQVKHGDSRPDVVKGIEDVIVQIGFFKCHLITFQSAYKDSHFFITSHRGRPVRRPNRKIRCSRFLR